MKGNILVGVIAGTVLGVVATAIAMPYIGPQVNKLMNHGKKMISHKLNQMEFENNGG